MNRVKSRCGFHTAHVQIDGIVRYEIVRYGIVQYGNRTYKGQDTTSYRSRWFRLNISCFALAFFVAACGSAETTAPNPPAAGANLAVIAAPTDAQPAVDPAAPALPAQPPQPQSAQPQPIQPQGPAVAGDVDNVNASHFVIDETPGTNGHPTLADYWEGRADFRVDVPVTGLPMGESETIQVQGGELWSYVHASDRSAKVIDRCGAPVEFPGCTVIYKSTDGGLSFDLPEPVCQFDCNSCPCTPEDHHINQQQYPRVASDGMQLHLVYEFGAMVFHRTSPDGLTWNGWNQVPWTGVWDEWLRPCPAGAGTNEHPFVPEFFDCLMGGPPGVAVDGDSIFVFVGMGQNPGAMGCYKGSIHEPTSQLTECTANPLFVGVPSYGPLEEKGPATNPYYMFRTVSSADVQKVGDVFYMLFEGVRGPGPGDPGDTQFAVGLARSQPNQMDGPWEQYDGNPILVDLPGNIGLGHADLVVLNGQTVLYTSLDGETRSRLVLEWN